MSDYLKPQSPLYHKDKDAYFYPLTTADQVIMEDGSRLNSVLKNIVKSEVVLPSNGWSAFAPYTQTIAVSDVTEDNNVIVTSSPTSHVSYGESGVYCSAQASGKLIFTCAEIPTSNLTVNVLILA